MTKAEQTEQTLTDMGVQVFPCPALARKAIASRDGFIGLGTLQDSREAHTVLAHELYHFKLDVFYPPEDAAARRTGEAKVHRALLEDVCPKDALRALLQRAHSVAEIAEELEITEQLVCEAFDFYQDRDPDFCKEHAK